MVVMRISAPDITDWPLKTSKDLGIFEFYKSTMSLSQPSWMLGIVHLDEKSIILSLIPVYLDAMSSTQAPNYSQCDRFSSSPCLPLPVSKSPSRTVQQLCAKRSVPHEQSRL